MLQDPKLFVFETLIMPNLGFAISKLNICRYLLSNASDACLCLVCLSKLAADIEYRNS